MTVEDMLKKDGSARPRRALRANFTQTTIRYIRDHPRRAQWWQPKELLMKLLDKPAIAVAGFVMAIAVSGTAYAAVTGWPNIVAIFGGQTDLPTGNKVVAVDTTNCNYFDSPKFEQDSKEKVFYEIKKDAPLTNEQIVSMVKGVCQDNAANAVIADVMQAYLPGTAKNNTSASAIMDSRTYTVKAITPSSITVELSKNYNETSSTLTFSRFSPDMKVFSKRDVARYDAIQPGDAIRFIVRDEHQLPSEADPTNPNHFNEPDLLTVLAIVKIPDLTGWPGLFYQNLGSNFVRVEPDSSSPTGYKRAYDFTN